MARHIIKMNLQEQEKCSYEMSMTLVLGWLYICALWERGKMCVLHCIPIKYINAWSEVPFILNFLKTERTQK